MRSKLDMLKGVAVLLGMSIFLFLAMKAFCSSKQEIAALLISMMQIVK